MANANRKDNKEIIGKIKQLDKIQPSSEWLNWERHNLMTHISLDEELDDGAGFFNWLKAPQSFALVVCLILIVFGGPWLMVKASQASLPGDILYSVKKISEDLQTTIASGNNKAQLKVDFASRRLEELVKINEYSYNTLEEKTKRTKQAIGDLRNELAEAGGHIKGVYSKEEVIAVTKKTKKIREELTKAKEEAPNEVQADLVEAEKAVEEISRQILASLVEGSKQREAQSATNTDSATSTDKEILIFFDDLEIEDKNIEAKAGLKIEDLGTSTITTTEKIIEKAEEF